MMASDEAIVCFVDTMWKETEQYYKCKKCVDEECKMEGMRCAEAINWALKMLNTNTVETNGSKGNKW